MQKEIMQIKEFKQEPMEKTSMKTGKVYWSARVVDGRTGRTGFTFGEWSKSWKIGDEVEVLWERNDWVNAKGETVEGWNIKDPNDTGPKPSFGGGGGYKGYNSNRGVVDSYLIAAALAPTLYKNKVKVHLDDIEALANAVAERLKKSKPEEKAVEAPKAEAKEEPKVEEPKAALPDIEEDDDDSPF